MFRTKIAIILLLFYLVAGLVVIPVVGGFMQHYQDFSASKVVIPPGSDIVGFPERNIFALARDFFNFAGESMRTFVQGINLYSFEYWAVLFLLAAGIAVLFALAIGRGFKRILGEADRLASGDYHVKLAGSGLFSLLNKRINNLSAALSEKEEKEKILALEERNSTDELLGKIRILLAEGKGKADVLYDSSLFADSSFEKKMALEIGESIISASNLIEKHLNSRAHR